MITGVHALIYSNDAEADRAFFRETLGTRSIDAGEGWLIFALPPAELGIHPAAPKPGAGNGAHELYLMCDDIQATVAALKARGAGFTKPVQDAGWGLVTAMRLPGGSDLHLYEPRHASPLK